MNNGKIIFEGDLELLTPLHVGSGESDFADLDVIKDSEGKPFITFTSFIGAIRHRLNEKYDLKENELNKWFGFANDDKSLGSKIIGSDLFLCEGGKYILMTRDGIKINIKTGIVIEGAKYDYQIVDKGAKFSFKLEAAYSDKESRDTLLKYLSTISRMLKENIIDYQSSGLRIGAKTNNGLGKIQLINEKVYEYDFAEADDVIAWLKGKNGKAIDINEFIPFETKENDLIIDAYFDLKTSIIQRSYNDDPSMPDASHTQSAGKDILTGSGAKGAITARARKIANTIWSKNREEDKTSFLDTLLGYVYDKKDKDDKRVNKDAKKAKLQIEERELPAYAAELQSRIKIDRFTGGTINGALFDSMPLFNTKELNDSIDLGAKTRITITVKDCNEAEAGLMLLVLKDLWTGDLAIGGEKGIGRGVFNGVSASIKFKSETITLEQGLNKLSELQKYVDALVKEAGGKK